jgi:crotonobetainyl-CoA:carnitine CoA-transferase CaiB-like acyl-CoA transferase
MGLDYASLSATHPRLIVCDISGYGQDGPDRDRKAYDLLIQSESGFLSTTGTPNAPAKAGCSIADIAAGMYAYSNILAALIERGRTGRGRHIDVSMLEAMAEWMGFPMYYAFDGAPPPPRVGAFHATIFPYGPFAAQDGEVMLGVQNEREWRAMCDIVLRDPALAQDPRYNSNSKRSAARQELKAVLETVFKHLDRDELVLRLDEAKIANAKVNDMAGLWAHPQLQARGRWRDIETPAGQVPALLPPGQTDAHMGPIPRVGQHNQSILAELGMADSVIAA